MGSLSTEEEKSSYPADKIIGEIGSLDNGSAHISPVDTDEAILRANGHTTAMKRQFNWFAALGLAFTITNSWVGYLVRALRLLEQNIRLSGPLTPIFRVTLVRIWSMADHSPF